MNEETYNALKEVVAYAHQQLNLKKRLSTDKYHMLIKLNNVEGWMHEVAKEYTEDVNVAETPHAFDKLFDSLSEQDQQRI